MIESMWDWMKILQRGQISECGFAQLIAGFCDEDKDLIQYFSGKAPTLGGLASLVTCWKKRDALHQKEWDIVEVKDKKDSS